MVAIERRITRDILATMTVTAVAKAPMADALAIAATLSAAATMDAVAMGGAATMAGTVGMAGELLRIGVATAA